jgi:hypothetical protein
MKVAYWLIPSLVAIAAVVGVAVATVNRQSSLPASPTVSIVPSAPIQSLPAEATSASPAASTPPALPPQSLSESPVTLYGIGAVSVGMTVEEASRAAGVSLISEGESGSSGCSYVRPQDQPRGMIGFMVTDGRIARVDISGDSRIKTLSGLGIGSTETEIEARFPGQIEVTPHEYVQGGHYLAFVPRDESDRSYRIIFETDPNGRVTRFRSGKLSEVAWVEGCA